ncbi:MAG: 3' terminal RNA ribose 2'-O-methyltransferase Hen1 [Armatimonadetes bacterium]|nr:3' terminal RNA ribose 2'-O-methyltransferase Hen1 [Armatimonadota bacterium]
MLLVSTTHRPATDLGYLLHKNPANSHRVELTFGTALVVFPEATEEACTAALLLEIDPVALSRKPGDSRSAVLEPYVNDRPYVANSFLSVALGRVYGTAMAGNCKDRPGLAETAIPLVARLPVLPAGSDESVRRLFAPLGYEVECQSVPLDETFPEWGASRYFDVTLRGTVRTKDLLAHLCVLVPALDAKKHYYVDKAEVEKLLRKGDGWLKDHPHRLEIAERYLHRDRSLVRMALDRLGLDDGRPVDDDEPETAPAKPVSLHGQRHDAVLEALSRCDARTVLDLGCGEGRLLQKLLKVKGLDRIVGMDVSYRALEIAARRLRLESMTPKARERIDLLHGSLTYRDARLSGFDAAVVVEVVEHLDSARLAAFERCLFEFARPRAVILTTPNRDYNVLYEGMTPGAFRHPDHRFEWSRAEFSDWCASIGARFGYSVETAPVGEVDPQYGASSQLAVFRR